MSQKRIKTKVHGQKRDVYQSVVESASGLHGSPLGVGQFLRKLSGDALRLAARKDDLLLLITFHARLIALDKPMGGIPGDQFENGEMMERMRRLLIIEHFRRSAILRVRYPQDPFGDDPPEYFWWSSHPLVEALHALPEEARGTLQSALLSTGDTGIMSGHLMVQPTEQLKNTADRLWEIEKNLSSILMSIEETYRDAAKLAWSEDFSQADGYVSW